MMEFYNNSFSNNYMNQKTFPNLDCEFSFSLVHDRDYSCSFSEFDYIKRVKKAMKNENLEKHFFEETKINKEKIIKNKSISSFKKTAESIFKQKNIEILSKKSEADKTPKHTSNNNHRETKNAENKQSKSLMDNSIYKASGDKEGLNKVANLSLFSRSVNGDLEYNFDYKGNSWTPKKNNTWAQAENMDKNRNDCEGKLNKHKNKNHIYDYENNNNYLEKENANESFYYYNSNINRKKSDKGIFESLNSLNYENKENYQYNKTDKKIKNKEFKYDQYYDNKDNQNKNNNHFNYIKAKNLNEINEKIKSETNNILVEKAAENQLKTINEEKFVYSEAEIARIEGLLINKILKSRNDSANKIIKNYRIHKTEQLKKEEELIAEILQARKRASVLIQSAFRSFFMRKNIKVILNKLEENYIFLYDYNKKYFQNSKCKSSGQAVEFEEEPNHDIKLQLLGTSSNTKRIKNCELLNFTYSKFLKCYMLVFKKKGLIRRNYKVNFIVNGNIIIDPRFKLDADEDGKFYNVIESHMLLIKNKIKNYENKLRYMALENRENSPDDSGVSTAFNSSSNTKALYTDCNNSIFSTCKKTNFENPFSNNKHKKNNNKLKNPDNNFPLQESKYWEDIFKIKVLNNYRSLNTNSVSSASESQGDVDRIFTRKSCSGAASKCKTPQTSSSTRIKPCLKKQSSSESFEPLKKCVSFNDNIQISFFLLE